jgi:diaminopimelate decarboxylase
MTIIVRNHLTLEERTAKRAEIVAKWGKDYMIQEAVRDQIVAIVEKHWTIIEEEFTGHRLSLRVNPRMTSTNRQRYDAEGQLLKFGDTPHMLGSEFTQWSLSFYAN